MRGESLPRSRATPSDVFRADLAHVRLERLSPTAAAPSAASTRRAHREGPWTTAHDPALTGLPAHRDIPEPPRPKHVTKCNVGSYEIRPIAFSNGPPISRKLARSLSMLQRSEPGSSVTSRRFIEHDSSSAVTAARGSVLSAAPIRYDRGGGYEAGDCGEMRDRGVGAFLALFLEAIEPFGPKSAMLILPRNSPPLERRGIGQGARGKLRSGDRRAAASSAGQPPRGPLTAPQVWGRLTKPECL